MSKPAAPPPGSILWHDLTVNDADRVRDFYREVVGWKVAPVEMTGYQDYGLEVPDSGDCVAGVCHARGVNSELPPHWLTYVAVADVAASAERCRQLGGEVIEGPRAMGDARLCVIRDPAGAYLALVSA